jgi:signal recognition particle receptor subunit beta
MTRLKLLAIALVLVALGGVATQATAVQSPALAQAGNGGGIGGVGNQGVAVTGLTAPESAPPGEEVTVTATLSNPTDGVLTERVEFRFGGDVVDRSTVTLNAGETTTVTGSVNTTEVEPGDYVYAVFTDSGGAVGQLTVSDSFTLDSLEAPSTATVGDTVTVNATVANPNEFTTTQAVEFRVAGIPLASQDVTLEADSSTTVSFELSTEGLAPGEYIHGAFTRDRGAFATLTLETLAETTASVTFEDQTSDGTTVTVAEVTLPEDGYVAIHDSSLLDGEVVGSVIGVSEYREAGTYEDLNVTLFDVPGAEFNETELTENDTLIAMPHEETSNNTVYDFVATDGMEDGPFVADGQPVTDSAAVTVAPGPNVTEPNATTQASVVFENQTSDGTSVTVANATLPDDGYVAIHDSSLLDGEVVGSVVGVSEYLGNGTYENLTVTLFDVPGATFNETVLTENDTLIAMPHEETNNNTVYDFVATDGMEDGPFLVDGEPVVDSGLVTVAAMTPPADNGTAGNGTAGDGTAGNGTAGNGTAGNGTAGNGTAGNG